MSFKIHASLNLCSTARSAQRCALFAGMFLTSIAGLSSTTAAQPVALGLAGNLVILSAAGITDVSPSPITGNVGTSPITGAADLLTCAEVAGLVLSVDATGPSPCSIPAAAYLTAAINDMRTAYKDAKGRAPTVIGLYGGSIGVQVTLPPGVYKWSGDVAILKNVTLSGSATDIWIFQIGGNLDVAHNKGVFLDGGALPRNIFWQVAGGVTFETAAHMQGIILSKTLIAMKTGASITGRLYAQTAVTLQMNAITQP